MNRKIFIWLVIVTVILSGITLLLVKGRIREKKAIDLNLLFITIDTMRADRIGAYGCPEAKTPNLDYLAKNGVMFENCYTPVPLTLPSHCSIFTGRYPISHLVRDNGTFFLNEREETLAEKFKEKGYHTFSVIASFILASKFGLNQGFDFYEDSLNINEMITNFDSEIPADSVYTKFNQWFKKNIHHQQRFFAWIHFFDPHAPYEPPAEYRNKFSNDLEGLYNGEVAFTDLYIGKIIEDLKSENQLDQTLVIITGDHGEAFGEHDEWGHGIFCYEEALKVPLIFFNSRLFRKDLKIKNRVNLIDIMPTILELYGVEIPIGIQGKSFAKLLDGKGEKEERTIYIESMHGKEELGWAPLTGIIDDRHKYISLPEPELYNLEKDKQEKNNLFLKKNKLAKEMNNKLMKLLAKHSTHGRNTRRELTEEDKKHLQTLGYISSFSNKSKKNIDPKKGIIIENQLNDINREVKKGNLEDAEMLLKDIAEKNPLTKTPQYYELLSKIYEKKGNLNQLINIWEEAAKVFPENNQIRINLAFKLSQAKKFKEAEKLAFEIIKSNPKYTRSYILLGSIEEKRGNIKKALKHFEKAINLEPKNVSLKIKYGELLVKNKKYDKAMEICKALLENDQIAKNPENVDVKSKIGIILTEINQDEEALEVLQEVLAVNDSDAVVWNYLGVILYRKNEYHKAMEAYSRSIELDPKFALAYNNQGTLYLTIALKNRDKVTLTNAINSFNRAIKNDSQLASAYNGRGSAYRFSNRIADAIKDWKRALKIKPDFTDVYFNIGVTYLKVGNRKEALRFFKTCREKFYDRLSSKDRARLTRLIAEAEG